MSSDCVHASARKPRPSLNPVWLVKVIQYAPNIRHLDSQVYGEENTHKTMNDCAIYKYIEFIKYTHSLS